MRDKENFPSINQLRQELKREQYKKEYASALRGTLYVLIVVAAIAVLISSLMLPVLQVSGDSMTPTLSNSDIIILVKTSHFETGDLCGFTWNNKTLIKRVIAVAGDWVEIDKKGNVSVNGNLLKEPYLSEKDLGQCDLTFPYQVPEDCFFAMGDHREKSIDSRKATIGSIHKSQVIGKILFRVYPFKEIGLIK